MADERDYVLGTHDAEIERLGLQNAVWRPRALDAWRRAGFTRGQKIIDVGCGPGYASADLAEVTGPAGQVIGIDQSERFLSHARASAQERRLDWVSFELRNLDEDALPVHDADAAWCRWIFAFVREPRELLRRIHAALEPGGRLAIHEYFDYATWRFAPRSPAFERLVARIMQNWRESGGEPDIGLSLPRWLAELGFTVEHARPIVDAVGPADFVWQWPIAFVRSTLSRLVESGHLSAESAEETRQAIASHEADPAALMITPGVLEIIATRR